MSFVVHEKKKKIFGKFTDLWHGGGSAAQALKLRRDHIFVNSVRYLLFGRATSACSDGFLPADARENKREETKRKYSLTSGNCLEFSAISTKSSKHLGDI